MPQEDGGRGIQIEAGRHGCRQRGPGQLGQELGEVDRRGRTLGKAAELGELTGELLQAARLGHQDLDGFPMLGPTRPDQGRHGQADGRERVAHLVRHPAGRLSESPEPFGLDFLRPRPLQGGGHVPQRGSQGGKLRRSPAGTVGRKRLHPANVPGPSDQLLDRPAELPREMATETDRGVHKPRADHEDHQSQPGVVVAAECLGSLQLADRAC